jgi:hypothetical protein
VNDVPDLAATLPECPPVPDRDRVSSWDLLSMDGHLEALARLAAWNGAWLAAEYQRQGRPHLSVMLSLAGAETKSPARDRPFHAARLDAYAAAYGLSGWYRGTDHADEGCHGADGAYWVVDRDTGRTAFRAHSAKEAAAWIKDNGGDQ